MSDNPFVLICSCCGAECGQRDQANGRCGSCGSFFAGDESVVETEVPAAAEGTPAQDADVVSAEQGEPDSRSDDSGGEDLREKTVVMDGPPPTGASGEELRRKTVAIDATDDDEGDQPEPSESEGLVKPRKLSPQFRRHIEMTWQPALAKGGMGAQHTISSESPKSDTKHDSFWQSIGTRRVSPVKEDGGGDYQLKDVIGEGSMGRVWSARQTSLDRNVAVKVPRPELAGTGSVGESQFISEVVVTGKLEHPNIVPIYELGRDTNGIPFYSMKHVQGRPWNELIEEKSERENIEILMKVCDAIAFAHDRDFLHRDIKPHNVIVGEFGEVSVMDWGIAVSLSKDPSRSWAAIASGPAGTPAYMAPEMAAYNASALGVVSDVYLLGAVLYEIVTGLPPHPCFGDTNEALLAAAANEIIVTNRNGELVDIARRAMATDPVDRYQSVKDLQDAIREYQSHRQSIALSESADQHLETAKKTGSSDEFARARFAYEEAIKLWADNTHAATGLANATIEHAKNALKQENFELGISMLDRDNAAHRSLLGSLESKKAARQRLAAVSKLAAAVAVGALLIVAVAMYIAWDVSDTAKAEAQSNFEEQRRLVGVNQGLLNEQKKLTAQEATLNAELSKQKTALEDSNNLLDVERKNAVDARQSAEQAERDAKEASYASDIGIAAASIRRNEFPKAAKTLTNLAVADPIVSRLRHIEWGILQHSANPPVKNLIQDEPIAAVASSKAGDVIAAGTEDGRVFVWFETGQKDENGEPIRDRVEALHGTRVNAVALSDKGDWLATAGIDNRLEGDQRFVVRLWSTSNEQLTETDLLTGHTAEVLSVVFSDDDARFVLTSAADRAAIKWDRESGDRLTTMRDHLDKQIWSARFSPVDTNRIVTACEDGRVRVWDTSGDTPVKKADYRRHIGPVYAAVFSLDGETVFSGGYGRRLLQWKIADHPAIEQIRDVDALMERTGDEAGDVRIVGTEQDQHESSIRTLRIALIDGTPCLLSGGNDNTARVWSQTGDQWQLDKTLRGHGRWVRDCVFSGQGQTVVSGAYDGLKVWSWQDYSMPRELFANPERQIANQASELGLSPATGLAYSTDGWIATAYQNGTVAVWNSSAGDKIPAELLGDGHDFLTASGRLYDNGTGLLTSAGDNTTRLWSVERGTQLTKLDGTGWRGAAAINVSAQNGVALIATGSDDRLIPAWLWRVKDGKVLSKQPLLQQYSQSILVRQTRTMGSRLDNRDLDRIRRIKRRIPDVTAIAFSDIGDQLLVGNSQGLCFLFSVDTASGDVRPIANFVADVSSVRAAVFLPAGDSVITASTDGQIIQWDTATGQRQRRLPSSAPVTSLALSADGQQLLVGHSPVKGTAAPVAQMLDLAGDEVAVRSLPLASESHDWTTNPPSVQSARFAGADNRVVLSLFFPNQQSGDQKPKTRQSSYQLGFWEWRHDGTDFQPLNVASRGEISSANLYDSPEGSRLLVVGGKGARLLATDETGNFTELTASFRSAAAITSIGFAYDQQSKSTKRLVTGDNEGNVRIWELVDGRWLENSGAAAQLTGGHSQPVVATRFHPRDRDRLLTADQTGKWILWNFDGTNWTPGDPVTPDLETPIVHCVLFSPDGSQIFMGTDDHARVWRQQDPSDLSSPYKLDRRWETGRVQAASFSADGSWVVTSDGDEFVRFWSSNGDELHRHSDEDIKGLTTLALSWDRRRMFTGNRDGEVMIWDTSKLVDTRTQEIKLLLTLEDHQRGVTSVTVSPDGRNLISADQAGRTIVSASEPIAPLSIAVTSDQVSHQPGAAALTVDPWMILSDPSRIADFSDAVLSVRVERDSERADLLAIGRLRMGDMESDGSESAEIVVPLDASTNAMTIQSMLRGLTYQVPVGDAPSLQTGAETADEVALLSRTLTVEVTGIRYRESNQVPADADARFRSTLSAKILIEIETDTAGRIAARRRAIARN